MGKRKGHSAASRGLPVDNRHRALELCRKSYSEDDVVKLCELATEAIRLWPDCAEAYIILAFNACADDYQEAGMLSRAYNASVNALGGEVSARHAGKLWHDELGRFCIIALSLFARSIANLTLYGDAAMKMQEALLLDEDDNLGNRHYAIACLVASQSFEQAYGILQAWDDPADNLIQLGWLLADSHSGLRGQAQIERVVLLMETDRSLLQWMVDPLSVDEAPDANSGADEGSELEALLDLYAMVWQQQPEALEWIRLQAGLDPARIPGMADLELPDDILDLLQGMAD